MNVKQWSRWQKAVVLCSLVYVALFVTVLVFKPGGEQFIKAFFDLYAPLPFLFAALSNIVYAWRGQHSSTPRRIGWLLTGFALLPYVAGEYIWFYYEVIRRVEVPVPSWADAGWLGLYPFLISGVILLSGSMPIAGRTRLLLDSAITASSAGVLSWYFVVQRLWQQSDVSSLGKVINVAYPLCDIMVLFAAVVLFNSLSSHKTLRGSLASLSIGIVLWAFGDSIYTYDTLNGTYQTGNWYEWTWPFGALLVGYAPLLLVWNPSQSAQPREEPSPLPQISLLHALRKGITWIRLVRVVMPYLAVIVSFSIVAKDDYRLDGIISPSVVIEGAWLIGLVILRQVFTLMENQLLTAQLRTFNANLEQVVFRRTQQLTALHQLTKAVNDTLQVEQVLAAAAEHTQRALQADAVVLWLWKSKVVELGQFPSTYLHKGLDNHPEILKFIIQQPMFNQVDTLALPVSPHDGQPIQSACLRAPLVWQQRPIGGIGVLRWSASFGQTEPELLESIGMEVGTALENARLYGAAVEAADRDPVTGLLNHRAVHQRLETEFERAWAQNQPLAVIMMDINNFKLFNDTYGHPAGDLVLKRMAQMLRDEFRKGDILGRYGGDEFIAILLNTDSQDAREVAQRLHDHMTLEGYLRPSEDRSIPIALSCGISAFPEDCANRHELIAIADTNLYAAKLSDEGIKDSSELRRAHSRLRADSSFQVLDAMVAAVDNKDRYTRRHSEEVTKYALWIAEELGLSEETTRIIRIGGLLHDIGKIGVPDEILRKPGRLTPEEYEIMKRHPYLGALIVGGVPDLNEITDIVRFHHERWDGQGYPDALEGEDIPLLGRLVAVADAFSAMTTDRPYRKALSWDAALEQIRLHTGTQFDPGMARAFLSAAAKRQSPAVAEPPGDNGKLPRLQEVAIAGNRRARHASRIGGAGT